MKDRINVRKNGRVTDTLVNRSHIGEQFSVCSRNRYIYCPSMSSKDTVCPRHRTRVKLSPCGLGPLFSDALDVQNICRNVPGTYFETQGCHSLPQTLARSLKNDDLADHLNYQGHEHPGNSPRGLGSHFTMQMMNESQVLIRCPAEGKPNIAKT